MTPAIPRKAFSMMMRSTQATLLLAGALAMGAPIASADGGHTGHGAPAVTGQAAAAARIGQPGDAAKASRTVKVTLSDSMRFVPARIDVKAGETIRFELHNTGKVDHEMVLGALDDLKAHARQMQANPGMAHSEPNQVHLAPGQRGSLIWRFPRSGTVDFACTVPGHLEAGMVGQVNVTR